MFYENTNRLYFGNFSFLTDLTLHVSSEVIIIYAGGVYKLLVLVSQSGRSQSRERSVCESKSFETQNTFDLGKWLQKSVCFASSKRSDAS